MLSKGTTYLRSSRDRLFLALLGFLVFIMPLRADDYISPELIRISTPVYNISNSDFLPPLGTYEYSVSWEGIPAASLIATVDEENGALKFTARAKTASGIDIFYKLRYTITGSLDSNSLTPSRTEIIHDENSKHKEVEIIYSPDGEVHTTRLQQNGSPDKKLDFAPHNTMLEPVSAAFLARAIDWKVGDTKTFDVFNGKSRYLITLTALEKKTIDFKGQHREVFVISPRVRTLTTTKANEKLREAKIYLTTDHARDILKIESSVFVGTVDTELETFIPTQKPFSDVRMAKIKESVLAAP